MSRFEAKEIQKFMIFAYSKKQNKETIDPFKLEQFLCFAKTYKT